MKKELIASARTALQALEAELIPKANPWRREDTAILQLADQLEAATLGYERDIALRELCRGRQLLAKVRKALEKIENTPELFGICEKEKCGDDISDKRIGAAPWAELCVCCESKREDSDRYRFPKDRTHAIGRRPVGSSWERR